MLVILDTNVLISAFLWQQKTSFLIPLIESGQITLCLAQETLDELARVLKHPKLKVRLERMSLQIPLILEAVVDKGKFFKIPKVKGQIVKVDPADDKFLILAKVSKAKYLVSGDKHLLKLRKFGTTKIVSVSEFLNLFI